MKLSNDQFTALALEHLDLLYRIANRLTRNPTAAEDLVQDTFVRAFRARNEFDLKEYGIRPWLVRIMHNLHISRSQREDRQPTALDEATLDGLSPAQISNPLASSTDPSAHYEEMDEEVARAVKDLPTEYLTVLLLWAIEDFSYKEIAVALDLPIGTVMSRLHRARGKLSERLADFARKERIIRE